MNLRITKLYKGDLWGALEVAFDSCPEGTRMIGEIEQATGLKFERPVANRFALRELHIAQVGEEEALDNAYRQALEIAEKYDEVHDSQKNMKGPDELTPDEVRRLGRQ